MLLGRSAIGAGTQDLSNVRQGAAMLSDHGHRYGGISTCQSRSKVAGSGKPMDLTKRKTKFVDSDPP